MQVLAILQGPSHLGAERLRVLISRHVRSKAAESNQPLLALKCIRIRLNRALHGEGAFKVIEVLFHLMYLRLVA